MTTSSDSARHSLLRRKSVSLCMIVRDEAAVVSETLACVCPHIDYWVIVDTGSVDSTREVVAGVMAQAGVPGELHERPWTNFGVNRTEALELCQGKTDYIWVIDADDLVVGELDMSQLRADCYSLRYGEDFCYWRPQVFRAGMPWRYVGVVHEYPTCQGHFSHARLEGAYYIDSRRLGARNRVADKYERDCALLRDAVKADPRDARSAFYLAQSYCDSGDEAAAYQWYARRADMDGWEEETFYAAYQAGVLLARRDDDAAASALIRAWEMRPQRVEPLYELSRLCRFRSWHQMAYAVASRGAQLSAPDDSLFVHQWIYEWGMRLELATAAYWVGERTQALALCELLLELALPSWAEEVVYETAGYCAPGRMLRRTKVEVPILRDIVPSFELAEIRLDVSPDWPRFNPTIASDGDGFRMVVRSANCDLDGSEYLLIDDDVQHTLNYLVELNHGLVTTAVSPLIDDSEGPPRYPSRINGYEDLRLVGVGGDWFALAAVRDRNPLERCEQALLRLDGSRITDVDVLRSPVKDQHEKNWMPFVKEDRLHFLYSCSPTAVLAFDPLERRCHLVSEQPAPGVPVDLRGGSQGIWLEDGLLFVTHEALVDSPERSYQHRFVLLDEDYRLSRMSEPFYFIAPQIEFCIGLARRDAELILTFGVGDHTAMLGILDSDDAREMLAPVSSRGPKALKRPRLLPSSERPVGSLGVA